MRHVDIGRSLKILMAKQDKTIMKLSELTKLSEPTIRSVRRNTSTCSLNTLVKLANKGFGISVIEFLEEGAPDEVFAE